MGQSLRPGLGLSEGFARDGFAIVPAVLEEGAIDRLCAALDEAILDSAATSRRAGAIFAARNLLALPAVREAVASPAISELAMAAQGGPARAVRAILFDKRPEANWPVPWHQDLSLAVREKTDLPGWGPWSVKAGVVHVQPPAAFLERMATLRLHIDDCLAENGALRLLPGTHRHGRLDPAEIASLRAQIPERVCAAMRGSVLVMRPLLLHASSPATHPGRRRVLHLEFAPPDLLPSPLLWADIHDPVRR